MDLKHVEPRKYGDSNQQHMVISWHLEMIYHGEVGL